MKQKNLVKTCALAVGALLCTGSMIAGVYSSTVQTASFNGVADVISFPHVDAKVDVSVDGVALETLVISEIEEKSEHTISGFGEALANSIHGNVIASSDEGRRPIDGVSPVVITITNTSEDYKLDYTISYDEQNLVNMSSEVAGDESKTSLEKDGSSSATYTISVDDENLSASGSFSWSISLTAQNA